MLDKFPELEGGSKEWRETSLKNAVSAIRHEARSIILEDIRNEQITPLSTHGLFDEVDLLTKQVESLKSTLASVKATSVGETERARTRERQVLEY